VPANEGPHASIAVDTGIGWAFIQGADLRLWVGDAGTELANIAGQAQDAVAMDAAQIGVYQGSGDEFGIGGGYLLAMEDAGASCEQNIGVNSNRGHIFGGV